MEISFSFNGTASSFQHLARNVSAAIEQEKITINKKEVTGVIRRAELETGLYLMYWNLHVHEDFILTNTNNNSQPYYYLTYFFDPAFEQIITADKVLNCKKYTPCTLLEYNNSFTRLPYKQGSQVDFLCVSFTCEWLKSQELPHVEPSGEIGLLQNLPEPYRLFNTSVTEQILSKRLVHEFDTRKYRLALKAITFNLIDVFISKHLSPQNDGPRKKNDADVAVQLEKKIRDSLRTDLPAIDRLAEEFLVSAATLKRLFKKHYGMGIYEYYLGKKMQLATQMLQEGNLSVTDTAYSLGYESVSHFVSLFKKQVGLSPNEVRKGAR